MKVAPKKRIKLSESSNKLITTPRPFLKWVGGKRQLLDEIGKNIPENYNRYFEPFLGGGAVYFRLIPAEKEAYLSDINHSLIQAYRDIRDSLENVKDSYAFVVKSFLTTSSKKQKAFFLEKREVYNSFDGPSHLKTALLIFLNKTCFNGVYRENSKGEFNVPYGWPNFKTLSETSHLDSISRKLEKAKIMHMSFERVLKNARAGDFIYLDPPYVPLTSTAHFTKYHASDFSMEHHVKLSKIFKELDKRGCYVLMSNSLVPAVQDLYKDFWRYTVEVDVTRTINCKGNLRKPVKEVLIKNY